MPEGAAQHITMCSAVLAFDSSLRSPLSGRRDENNPTLTQMDIAERTFHAQAVRALHERKR
eukprot:1762814-Alexandrium_andersonii.AAC.1